PRSLNILPRVRPRLPTRPTNRNSRRFGRQTWSGLLQKKLNFVFIKDPLETIALSRFYTIPAPSGEIFLRGVHLIKRLQWVKRRKPQWQNSKVCLLDKHIAPLTPPATAAG